MNRQQAYDSIEPSEVEMTRLWLVFAAIVFVILSTVVAIVAPNVATDSTLRYLVAGINVIISALAGGVLEYGRVKIKMVEELVNQQSNSGEST